MPRATPEYPTPELRQVRFVRATPHVGVELHQPIGLGEVRTIAGRVLGEMHVDGRLHHYRFVDSDGVVYLAPPEWLTPESVQALDAAGNAKRLAVLDNITRQLNALAVSLAARAAKPETVA